MEQTIKEIKYWQEKVREWEGEAKDLARWFLNTERKWLKVLEAKNILENKDGGGMAQRKLTEALCNLVKE